MWPLIVCKCNFQKSPMYCTVNISLWALLRQMQLLIQNHNSMPIWHQPEGAALAYLDTQQHCSFRSRSQGTWPWVLTYLEEVETELFDSSRRDDRPRRFMWHMSLWTCTQSKSFVYARRQALESHWDKTDINSISFHRMLFSWQISSSKASLTYMEAALTDCLMVSMEIQHWTRHCK